MSTAFLHVGCSGWTSNALGLGTVGLGEKRLGSRALRLPGGGATQFTGFFSGKRCIVQVVMDGLSWVERENTDLLFFAKKRKTRAL
jgi:hypothetical protein